MSLSKRFDALAKLEDDNFERAKKLFADFQDISRRWERVAHVQGAEIRELRSRLEAVEQRGHQLRLHDAA